MQILFILEPAIELGNPEFRFATLRSSIIPQIKALSSNGVKTHLIASDAVANKAMQDGYLVDINSISTIGHSEWTQGENSLERSIRHQAENFKEGEIDRLREIVTDKLPEGFNPDVIFVWESPMYFLKSIFPGVKIFYQMPGFFSRAPFPELIKFDEGLLDKSAGAVQKTKSVSLVDKDFSSLREQDLKFFQSINTIEPILNRVKHRFQGLVLFPLQIDNYFMIDCLLQRKRQFDIVLELLMNTPSNIGVIVTNYWSGRLRSAVLSEENIRYLRSKFDNFIYIEKFDTIPCISQLLLPFIDGVYTISSSVGYQAAYWGKPIYSVGTSHITKYNTSSTLNKFLKQVLKHELFHQDEIIRKDILETNYPSAWIKENPQHFTKWVINISTQTLPTPWSEGKSFLSQFETLRREVAYIKNSGLVNVVGDKNSQTHCAALSEQIHKHDIISFDIFDTLLYRPFKQPSDMFDFMESEVASLINRRDISFKEVRRKSEKLAFEAAIARGEGETSIDEIYENFQKLVECTKDQAQQVKELEMKMELDLLYVRKSAKTAFNQAISLGKHIIIISDMYLSRDFLEKVLEKNGYKGYKNIFVSSEIKQKKHSGRLFDHVLSELNVPASKILHIGDNLQADVIKAKERGIKPFHLPKALETFEKTDAYKNIWVRDQERHSLDFKMLMALIANDLQDNPYLPSRKGTLFSGDAWRLGYYGFGIFLLGYVKWIMEQAIKDKVKRIYFLSRDGLIMKKAYDYLVPHYSNAPESHYLLCSRRAVNLAKIQNEAGIIDLLNVDYASTSLHHLLNARFGLKDSDLDIAIIEQLGLSLNSRINSNHRHLVKEILLKHKDKIFSIAEYERNNYIDYLQRENFFDDGEISIADIGYAGTMQQSLYELISHRKFIHGYYLMTFRQALLRVEKNGLSAKGYLANFVDRHDTSHPFCKFVPLYETLFSSAETTFIKMERDWNGELQSVHMNRYPQEQIREDVVVRIHEGALNFISNTTSVLRNKICHMDIEPNKSMRALDRYFTSPHAVDAKIMQGVVFEDAYGGAGLKIILPSNGNLSAKAVWVNGKNCLESKQGKEASKNIEGTSNNTHHSHVEKNIIKGLTRIISSKKKYNKLINSPSAFFSESRNKLVKALGKVYFLR
ncbi:HAD family hydrolase [Chromobacterium violaceum]